MQPSTAGVVDHVNSEYFQVVVKLCMQLDNYCWKVELKNNLITMF
jgi:hypothetical protein